ncbi:ABC transporter substrate-binding protein [Nocardioides sp. zg-579]|uniref:Thiamine pyrimidine synthase n=1 Tax=Nocardioides marmotae TaxID=2663857 RepID=A0A6I3IUV4_9ACTN|nr:ABC transporter substrate-binding protein [Nocardioides marmotae]MCR6030597.1 ABC transporter substrate-binding protein [Gordonia jinghuaiqii]MTB94233.1 ABC transporter substrate-binding protein [Nocardioides marmotae]QKE00513.1 ABC transporter substrate-binding protein [Nocardioides marmotae]
MTSRSRTTRAGALLAAALLSLTACGEDADAEPAAGGGEGGSDFGAITLQLSWIKNAEFAGEFFADTAGHYEDAGFTSVTMDPGPGAIETLVATEDADFGLSNAVSTAQVIAEEDAPLKIVGTKFQKNPFTILSLADGGDIATPEDLVGKKIGVQAGGNETLFDALLEVNGIDPSDVEKVPVEYDPAPLIDGEVDGFLAYITNESITVQAQGMEVTNLPFADNGLPFVAESVITTERMIEEEPEKVKAFLEAEIRGWQDALADPDESARLAVEEYGKDLKLDMAKELEQAEVQTGLIVTPDVEANGLFTITDELIEQNLATLAAAGIEIEAEDLFDLSLLTELLEEKPELTELPS